MYKIAELFTGTGAFSLAFKHVDAQKFKVVFANDFEPTSKQIFDANNDIELTCKDLASIKAEEIPSMDILTAGFPCFTKGTPVLTKRGYINIEDVECDDSLLTHKGTYKNILNKQIKVYSGILNNIKCMYIPETIKCTPDHPFYVRKATSKYNKGRKIYEISEPEWLEAKDVDTDTFIGIPVNSSNDIPSFKYIRKFNKYTARELEISIDKPHQWFMIGYFLGDGWIQDNKKADGRLAHKIFFVIANEHIKHIREQLELNFKLTFVESVSKCSKFVCSNQGWWTILNTLGRYAHGKKIPSWIQDAPKEMLHELVKGYACADGDYIKRDGVLPVEIQSVSRDLALGFQRIFLKLGVIVSVSLFKRKPQCTIQGRTCNQRDTYKIIWRNQGKKRSFVENDHAWVKVRSNRLTSVENEHVYNFEVEHDNSYVVQNLCVHNCQPFSIAGMQNGFNDPRSNIFWKIIEILRKHQPRIAILENVKNLQAHDNGNTFRTITESLQNVGYELKYKIMNTCKHTIIPQNRERIYVVCFRQDEDFHRFQFPEECTHECVPIEIFLEENVHSKYYYKDTSSIWDKLKESVNEDISTNAVYQYRRYYVRKNKSGVCPTLTANMGLGGHNVPIIMDSKGIRKLTPKECFGLQGFDDTYVIPNNISDAKAYKLAGNAVSVPVVELIVKQLPL